MDVAVLADSALQRFNPQGTVNSETNPAHLGSEITIWATGLGPINPLQADGSLVGLPLPVNVFPVGIGRSERRITNAVRWAIR